jgi:DNA polymerase III subunit delta'
MIGPGGEPLLPWLVAPLAQALAQQRAHALLVHGAPGIGSLQFALALAQGWLCEADHAPGAAPGAQRPCGHCASCRLLQSRAHPDLLVLLPEALRVTIGWSAGESEEGADGSRSKRKPSRQIRIDEVRGAIDWIVRTASRGGAKVVVMHPADTMNPQAASALLKTLEEPPRGARLVLTCAQPAHLLPTVRSRCQRMPLPMPARGEALAWLAGQGIQGAEVMLAAAGGRPLEALELVAAGVDAAAWSALPTAVARGRAQALAGWPVARAVDALQKLCHDAMVQGAGGAPRFFPSLPGGARLPALVAWSQRLSRTARDDEHPWNEALLIEALVAQGSRAWLADAGSPRAATAFDTLLE